jgi:transcription initiation factor TFIID TATA-box-binding protein
MDAPFRIVNVVATVALDRAIDLESLAQLFPREVVHDEQTYGGRVAYFKSATMQGKVTIFRSGKMISVGTRSPEEARRELILVAKALKSTLKTEPTIQNIVVTASLEHEVDLEKISTIDELRVVYEPEQFPGAIITIRLSAGKTASILLFASGKLVCVGLRNVEQIREAIQKLITLLQR